MKTSLTFLILVLSLILSSCEKEKQVQPNEFTLDSATSTGFYFRLLKIIDFPNSNGLMPDFFVMAQVNDTGEVVAPFLGHSNLEGRFILSAAFDNSESAQTYFNAYSTPEDKPMLSNALNVQPHQIWLVKTNAGKFGKILILTTEFNNIDDKDYAKITFKAENLNE
jgi:hypothetical protein